MASLKQLAAQGVVKKTDLFRVRLNDLYVEPGFNLRTEGDDLEAHIDAIAQTIMDGGPIPPLEVRVADDGRVLVVDGHCRRRAYQKAVDAGCPIEWIDVLQFKGNDADRVAKMLTSSMGKALSPLETAMGYKRLIAFGWEPDRVAKHHGKTRTHVDQMLLLANANSDVHRMVSVGAVAAHTALDFVREHGEKAGDKIAEALEKAKAGGKSKVTAGTVNGRALPRKLLNGMVSRVESFASRIDRGLVDELRNLPEESLSARKVEISAADLLELIQIQEEVAKVKAKREQAQPNEAAPAGDAGE